MQIDKPSSHEAGDGVPSAIAFRLDPHSGAPPYKQLVQQVERAVRLGYLTRGDQLPRVKDVVAALSINPNTVLKAYRELEQKGIAAGRPGTGTFIQVSPQTVGLAELKTLRQSLVTGWLREAATAGLTDDEIMALFTHALGDFRELPVRREPGQHGNAARAKGGSAA